MTTHRRRPLPVDAIQWTPGVKVDGLITDPVKLAGLWWAHLGHQREVGPNVGIIKFERTDPYFVHEGDWIVTDADGRRHVVAGYVFEAEYEPVEP